MTVFNVHEAKTHLSQLLDRFEAGEEIIIARSGKPIAKLTPAETPKRKFGFAKGRVTVPESFFEPMSKEDLSLWERDLDL